jgi:hypothetical protein
MRALIEPQPAAHQPAAEVTAEKQNGKKRPGHQDTAPPRRLPKRSVVGASVALARATDPARLRRAHVVFQSAGAIIGYENSRQILAEPIAWVWDRVIAAHHAVEICGPSYTGKSTLTFLLAAARANPTGRAVQVLGRAVEPMAAGRFVVVANEENGRQSAVAKIDAAIEMLGLPARETWDRIMLLSRARVRAHEATGDEVRNPSKGDAWAALLHAAHEGTIDLVVLDTRARIFAGFGNPKDEDAQAKAAAAIVELIEATGAPVLVVSHTRKGAAEEIEDVSGSAQRGGGADTILMLTAEREGGKVLSSKVTFLKLRDGIDDHPEPVTFSTAKGDDGRWRVALDASAKPEDSPLHERIYQLVLLEELTQRQIRERLKVGGDRCKLAVDLLKTEKRIKFRKTKIAGRDGWLIRATGGNAALLKDVGIVKSANSTSADDFGDPYDV